MRARQAGRRVLVKRGGIGPPVPPVQLTEDEAVNKGIGGIELQFVSSGDVGGAGNFGDDGLIRTKLDYICYLTGEDCAKDALNREGFVLVQFSTGVL